jgi:hypothetical protein
MGPDIISELTLGTLLDNNLAALAARAGEPPSQTDLIELSSQVRSLYTVITLSCRELRYIDECRLLWSQGAAVFEGLRTAWIETNGNAEMIEMYLRQLERLLELSRDRVGIYSVDQSDRQAYADNKEVEPVAPEAEEAESV